MPIQPLNDISLYYEIHGQGEPLVLIGGLTSDHQVWKSALRVFSKYYQVLIFDNRGAGQSSTPDLPYTTHMMATDTVELMRALGIEKAHIIGHSMGGCIASQMAIHYPDAVRSLVVACSRAQRSHLADLALSMRKKLMEAHVSDVLLAEYMMPFLFSESFLKSIGNIKGFVQWTVQNPFPQSAIGFKQQLHAVLMHDISDKLHQITAPTLVIAGEEDCLMPAKTGEAFAKALPNAQFRVIKEAAHMPHVEQPTAFTDAISAFLNSTSLAF